MKNLLKNHEKSWKIIDIDFPWKSEGGDEGIGKEARKKLWVEWCLGEGIGKEARKILEISEGPEWPKMMKNDEKWWNFMKKREIWSSALFQFWNFH